MCIRDRFYENVVRTVLDGGWTRDKSGTDGTAAVSYTHLSDALNTQFILDMMLAINPDVKTVGLLYSNSEANSTTPIAEAKAYLDEKGIAYVEGTGNTNDEIMSAAANMVGKADAVFTPVSYTHLDVYKRQVVALDIPRND